MSGRRDPASARQSTHRRRILFVREDELAPERTADGMWLRGSELVEMLQQSYDVALLTRRTFSSGAIDVDISCPDWRWTLGTGTPARWFKRVGWMAAGARFMASGRKYLRAHLAGFRPDLIFLHKFGSLHPGVLYELLARPVPIVVRFGDCHAQRLAARR